MPPNRRGHARRWRANPHPGLQAPGGGPAPPRPVAEHGALPRPPHPPPPSLPPPPSGRRATSSPLPLLAQPAARRQACPPWPADAAGCAPHARPADMQSRRDSHRAPPGRPVSLKIGPQIKSNPYPYPYPSPAPNPRPNRRIGFVDGCGRCCGRCSKEAESPPANPRFFLEGAHGPRGRHRVFSAKPDGAPTGDPPPHGRVHTTTASPPPPPQPPQKGTPARRVGDIVPCRAAMNRHGPTPGDTRPPPPPRSRGAPVVPRAGSNPPPPLKERPPSGALAQPPGASRDSAPS